MRQDQSRDRVMQHTLHGKIESPLSWTESNPAPIRVAVAVPHGDRRPEISQGAIIPFTDFIGHKGLNPVEINHFLV
jgi:hypothetical protein